MTTRFICISFDPLESQSSAGVQLLVAPNPAVGDPWSNLCERRDFFKSFRGRRVLSVRLVQHGPIANWQITFTTWGKEMTFKCH